MIRLVDFLLALFSLVLTFPLTIFALVLAYLDTGSPIFKQKRVGKHKVPFYLYKFRTMHKNTASVASHLTNPNQITKFGKFLRASKIDELPQLYNVLKGDMSLVGPRPNLFNQKELIQERDQRGVYSVKPGITGKAQINRIDMSTPILLSETDAEMVNNFSFGKYLYFALRTVFGGGSGDRVRPIE